MVLLPDAVGHDIQPQSPFVVVKTQNQFHGLVEHDENNEIR